MAAAADGRRASRARPTDALEITALAAVIERWIRASNLAGLTACSRAEVDAHCRARARDFLDLYRGDFADAMQHVLRLGRRATREEAGAALRAERAWLRSRTERAA